VLDNLNFYQDQIPQKLISTISPYSDTRKIRLAHGARSTHLIVFFIQQLLATVRFISLYCPEQSKKSLPVEKHLHNFSFVFLIVSNLINDYSLNDLRETPHQKDSIFPFAAQDLLLISSYQIFIQLFERGVYIQPFRTRMSFCDLQISSIFRNCFIVYIV
jgi:hypothetical protein